MKEIWKILPNDILNIILKYDGKIKYRNGKYINQLNIKDRKFNLLNQILIIKTNLKIKKYFSYNSNKDIGFYFRIQFTNIKIAGIICDYYDNEYIISFYKDIKDTFYYKIINYYYSFFKIYNPSFFILNYEYK
jgi:hypothetical protein